MKSKKHQKLYEHYVDVMGKEPVFSLQLKKDVLSDVAEQMKPVTTYVFEPTDELPFWKLCTIGASDYVMPERKIGWGRKANRRNEYVMFISPEVEVSDPTGNENADTGWLFLNSLLWATAEYAFNEKDNVTVSDTIDMGLDGKYCGVVLLLPEVFKTPRIVKCYISKNQYISIFQVMPVTKEQLAKKHKKGTNGIYWLMEEFYTHDDDYKLVKSKPLASCETMGKYLIESLIAEEYSQRYFDECQFVWQNYVPLRGRAKTLQGELLREIERIRCEAQDNGNVNWNNEYARYCDFISRSLTEQSIFSENQKEIVIAIMAYIKDCGTYAKKYNDGEIEDCVVEPEKLAYTDDNLYDIICDFIGKLQKEHPEPIKL